ncbi:MAG TPA: SRPBCC family protein [Micromonosporaceae bacterium]|jgi:hypothetical protein|nr:SRPBCC family protein [Micromonosporaceae bacterium]
MSAGDRQIGASNGGPDEAPTTEVTAAVIVNAPAERVFEALTAWERQSEWIPFTTVKITKGDGGVGSTIEAVTTIGPAVLTDTMRIEAIDRPYQVRVMHTGKILRGPGVMRCTAMGPGRTQVVWHERFQLPAGLAGKLASPLLWPGSKAGLTRALRRFARLVEDGAL